MHDYCCCCHFNCIVTTSLWDYHKIVCFFMLPLYRIINYTVFTGIHHSGDWNKGAIMSELMCDALWQNWAYCQCVQLEPDRSTLLGSLIRVYIFHYSVKIAFLMHLENILHSFLTFFKSTIWLGQNYLLKNYFPRRTIS